MIIRPITPTDAPWVAQALTNLWGSTRMVSRGKLFDLTDFEGFIAEDGERKVGLITYVIARSETRKQSGDSVILNDSEGSQSINRDSSPAERDQNDNSLECEIMSINSLTPGKGIGAALLAEVEKVAKEKGCKTLLVITTNDNPKAVTFYEKNGFTITEVRKNIMDENRKLKPEIPLIGNDGIVITDEIELQKAI